MKVQRYEKIHQKEPANQNLRSMRASVCLAQEMGKVLGGGEVL